MHISFFVLICLIVYFSWLESRIKVLEKPDRDKKQREKEAEKLWQEQQKNSPVEFDWTLNEEQQKAAKYLGFDLSRWPKTVVEPRSWEQINGTAAPLTSEERIRRGHFEVFETPKPPSKKRLGFGEYHQDKYNAIKERELAEEFAKYGPKI